MPGRCCCGASGERASIRGDIEMRYRMYGLVALAVIGMTAVAQDKGSKEGGHTYLGKVTKVDARGRALTMERNPPDQGGNDKDRGSDRRGAFLVAFTLSRAAEVTLDGKKADLDDLKTGHFVRIHSPDRNNTDSGKDAQVHTADRVEAYTKEPSQDKK